MLFFFFFTVLTQPVTFIYNLCTKKTSEEFTKNEEKNYLIPRMKITATGKTLTLNSYK